jgi:hypothetical protein
VSLMLARLPMLAMFAVAAIMCGLGFYALMAIVEASGYVPGVDLAQDHTWRTAIFLGIAVGIAQTFQESRARSRDGAAERDRYLKAVASGQPSGGVGQWAEWIRRDRKSIYAPLIIGIALAGLGVAGIVIGPLWAALVVLAFAAVSVGLDWHTRNRLQTLSENLATPTK